MGDVRWVEAVKGTAIDFERVGKIDSPAHEETVRALIAAADSHGASNYAKRLRNVIFLRAQRIANVDSLTYLFKPQPGNMV